MKKKVEKIDREERINEIEEGVMPVTDKDRAELDEEAADRALLKENYERALNRRRALKRILLGCGVAAVIGGLVATLKKKREEDEDEDELLENADEDETSDDEA